MKTHFSPVSQRKNLGYALRPYKHWDEWVQSSAKPFTKKDLALIEAYRLTGSYATSAEQLHITMIEAANQIIAIILKLKFHLSDYRQWEAGQKSLYNAVTGLGVQSLQDLKVIKLNDLKQFFDAGDKNVAKLKVANKPLQMSDDKARAP